MHHRSGPPAFTLLEILIVVLAIGILSTLVVGGLSNVVPAGRQAAAVNKARIVNAARITFSLTVADAAGQWAGASTDIDRAALLINAGALNGEAAEWLAASGGYSLSLGGGLKDKTVLRDRAGAVLDYPDS